MNEYSPGLSEFFKRAARLPLLTAEQELRFGRAAATGDRTARNKLVEHNIRLAIKEAKKYRGKGLPFEDLVQHAVLGLHHAAAKYDAERGYRFTTYAMWWIHHHLQRATQNEGATIRVPGHITIRRAKIYAALEAKPDATEEELAIIADCKPHQVEEALRAARVTNSLDAPESVDADTGSLYDRIPDPNVEHPHDVSDGVQIEALRAALTELSPEQRAVLELRFGLNGQVMSRDDVARRLRMEPHAVRRAQTSGLAELRAKMLRVDGGEAARSDRQGVSLLTPDRSLAPVCSRKRPEDL
jgi:RNA polymerase nonessential primary-like sigma factor